MRDQLRDVYKEDESKVLFIIANLEGIAYNGHTISSSIKDISTAKMKRSERRFTVSMTVISIIKILKIDCYLWSKRNPLQLTRWNFKLLQHLSIGAIKYHAAWFSNIWNLQSSPRSCSKVAQLCLKRYGIKQSISINFNIVNESNKSRRTKPPSHISPRNVKGQAQTPPEKRRTITHITRADPGSRFPRKNTNGARPFIFTLNVAKKVIQQAIMKTSHFQARSMDVLPRRSHVMAIRSMWRRTIPRLRTHVNNSIKLAVSASCEIRDSRHAQLASITDEMVDILRIDIPPIEVIVVEGRSLFTKIKWQITFDFTIDIMKPSMLPPLAYTQWFLVWFSTGTMGAI